MPTFNPTDPKEFARLLPENDYAFEVHKSEEGVGKASGDPYLKLTIVIFDADKEVTVTDYLSFGPKSHKKLWGFCQATGTEQVYHKGAIDSQSVEGLSGRLHLGVQEQEGYEPKNAVAYYKKPKPVDKGPLPKLESKTPVAPADDDIPF